MSPDPVERHEKFRRKFELPYRLLADTDHEVCEKYGVWKEKNLFGKKSFGVNRSTFIIGADGKVEVAMYGVSPKGHAEEVARRLAELT